MTASNLRPLLVWGRLGIWWADPSMWSSECRRPIWLRHGEAHELFWGRLRVRYVKARGLGNNVK